MNPFTYVRAERVEDAVSSAAENGSAKFIAGGTNLVDLLKGDIAQPSQLIDITRLPLRQIEETAEGGVRIGALVTNADVAYSDTIARRYPLLSRAILAGASPQIRNVATTGGNLLQRTRCYYFYDVGTPCNKRQPGTGCAAINGVNRIHAILGASEQCIATHPSDMCVALAALAAVVHVTGKRGARAIPFGDLHRLPGDTPHLDVNLEPGELITAVELPARGFAQHCAYLKVRERSSFAFALVAVAAALELDAHRNISEARIALGGVAHKPWRRLEAEALLIGRRATEDEFRRAAAALLEGARGHAHNTFKIELARRAVVRALKSAAQGAVQP